MCKVKNKLGAKPELAKGYIGYGRSKHGLWSYFLVESRNIEIITSAGEAEHDTMNKDDGGGLSEGKQSLEHIRPCAIKHPLSWHSGTPFIST